MEIKAVNFLVSPKAVENGALQLDEKESHHLTNVFRAKPGDIFYAIDGSGMKYRAVVRTVSGKKVTAEIISALRLENEPHIRLSLAAGLCRPARIDFIVEKGTELGINAFHFFVSENTLADDDLLLSEAGSRRVQAKVSRWSRLAQSAAKQSLRSFVPRIMPPVRFDDILAISPDYHLAIIADMTAEPSSWESLFADSPRDVLLLVGPEAGFTSDEVSRARRAGFMLVKLGPRRLRAETAAIVLASLVLSRAGDL